MIGVQSIRKAVSLIGAVFLFLPITVDAQEIRFSFQSDPYQQDFGRMAIHMPEGLAKALQPLEAAELKPLFRVYVGEQLPEDPTIPAIVGQHTIEGNQFIFKPRFDPPPGVSYTAVFEVSKAHQLTGRSGLQARQATIQKTFDVLPLASISGNEIAGVYPTADTLPANLLRMYIYFEQPMGLDNPHDHVELTDDSGQVINTPFVEITEGLWNNNRTRLTLFFHPGRVKRGVGPNMTMGTVLQPGKSYQLSFDPDWKDAMGRFIGTTAVKSFFVADAERTMIDSKSWIVRSPKPGTRKALIVDWPKPLDHALAKRMIRVMYRGVEVELNTELLNDEKQLQLVPLDIWRLGNYYLVIDPLLEDLAGNTPLHLFDTATEKGADSSDQDVKPIRVPFVVR